MDKDSIIKALRNGAQSASNTIADGVAAPIDMIAAGLRKTGLPVQNPVMGAQWMAEQGITAPVEPGMSQMVGETIGLTVPALGFAKLARKPQLSVQDTMLPNK